MKQISTISLLAAVAVTTSSAFAADSATASSSALQCVSAEAEKAVNECPGGPNQFEIKQKRGVAFSSAPPPPTRNEQKKDLGPKDVDSDVANAQRDLREGRLKKRGMTLLITEISNLEGLYKATPKTSPDRQQLLRRLAEGYAEFGGAAESERIANEVKADDAKRKKNKTGYDKAKKDAAESAKKVKIARKNAIKYYKRMVKEYPTYSKIDEILYYIAYEYEQDQNFDSARDAYRELIQKAPNSEYIPNAYLAFGELLFQQAMADPTKWPSAEAAYKKVIESPPPKNKVYGYARYKLAYVYWNSSQFKKAISEFEDVIKYADQYADLPGAKQLQKNARRDIVPVYAMDGDPKAAYNKFKPISGDKGGDNTETLKMLNSLGLAYLDTGWYDRGITLFRDLMSRDKGDSYCSYQVHITHAVQASQSADKEAIRKELDSQLSTRVTFNEGKHDGKAKHKCDNDTAELLAETAMSWHLEAVGSGQHRGTNDPKTMELAAYLYKKVVDNFTQEDFSSFEFPRIRKEDWPNIYKVKYAMADLLYVQERWADCGPAFDAVVAADPTGPEAPEAAYASVLCYQKMYDQAHANNSARKGNGIDTKLSEKSSGSQAEWEKFKPKPFDDMQLGMITAFNRYVCYIKPPADNKELQRQYLEVKFARARTYYESQHWEEAAMAFRDIAINHPESEDGIYAAHLYLESLNIIGAKSPTPKPGCFDSMAQDVPKFIGLYCEGKKAAENGEQCELLSRIQCDIERLAAQKKVEAADTGSANARELYLNAGDAYLEIWKKYGEQQLSSGGQSQCGSMDEILFNGAMAYQAGHYLGKAIALRKILTSPKYKLNETEAAQKAVYQLGGNYQAIAVYDLAAKYYLKYARDTKFKGEFANAALKDSVVLFLGLGQDAYAIAAADDYTKAFGARKPDDAAQIGFAIGAHYGEKGDWAEVVKKLSGATLRLIDSKANIDIKLQAHALLGKAYVKLKLQSKADSEYNVVAASWKRPEDAVKAIQAGGGTQSQQQRRLAKALTAVGEAYFHNAEKAREKVMAVKFPDYKGPATPELVNKHIQTKVAEWIGKKKPLIDAATAEYKKIVDLQPLPPPAWVVAAGARVGGMWSDFVKEFRAAPIPDLIKNDYELRTTYYAALDGASEPQKQTAKSAYKTCLDYSVKYQYFDEYSRGCEEWLAENYKNEFHLIDEFRGAPNRVNSVLAEESNPLNLGGEPIVRDVKWADDDKKDADKAGSK